MAEGIDISAQMERLKFGGLIHEVAEELSASLTGEGATAIIDRLYQEYVAAGKPRQRRVWVKERLEPLFKSVDKKPIWVGGQPMWPIEDGKPMVFIRQFSLGHSQVETEDLFPGGTLYLFGARANTKYGTMLQFRVVEDHAGLKGARVVPSAEGWKLTKGQ